MIASRRSPVPWPCMAEIASGSPRPRRWNSYAAASVGGSSILFATTTTGLCARRRIVGDLLVAGVTPTRASTTKATRSASSTARRACSAMSRVSGDGIGHVDAARVDEEEALPRPLDDDLLAVAGHPRGLEDDRLAGRGEAVDERGLADVREADDGHGPQQGSGHPALEGTVARCGGTASADRARASRRGSARGAGSRPGSPRSPLVAAPVARELVEAHGLAEGDRHRRAVPLPVLGAVDRGRHDRDVLLDRDHSRARLPSRAPRSFWRVPSTKRPIGWPSRSVLAA